MTLRVIKYSAAALYSVFLGLLIFYSFYFKRADIISGVLFLSSFFFLMIYAHGKNAGIIDKYLFYAVLISAVLITVPGFFTIFGENPGRIRGVLGDRAFEADAAALILVFLSARYMFGIKKKPLSILTLAAVFLSAGYLSVLRSRTSYLSVLVCLIVFTVWFMRSWKESDRSYRSHIKKRFLMLIAVTSISIAASSLIPYQQPPDRDSFKNLVSGMFSTEGTTNRSRIYFAKASLNMFLSNPVAGVGAGLWTGTYPMYEGAPFTDANVDVNSAVKAHNDFLELISEYGIPGLFYLLLFAYGLISLVGKFHGERTVAPYLSVAICFSVSSLFGFPKDNLFASLLFLACLSAGFTSSSKENIKKRLRIIKILFLPLIFLISAGLLFMRISIENNYLEGINLKFKKDYQGALNKLSGVSGVLYPVDRSGVPVDYYRGTMYFELKEYGNSLEAFENASLLMPYYPTVMSNKASALYKSGRVAESIELYREIKDLFPNFLEPQINLLAVYANEKRDAEAVNLLKDLDTVTAEPKFIKNYIVFSDIKNYYKRKGL